MTGEYARTFSSTSASAGITSRPYGDGGVTYLKLNNWFDNLQPRLGFSWDPSGKGKTKIFANYARFVETPLPLDINVRAGGGSTPDRQELQRQPPECSVEFDYIRD